VHELGARGDAHLVLAAAHRRLAHAPAEPVRRLDDDAGPALGHEEPRRGEARAAAADDDDVAVELRRLADGRLRELLHGRLHGGHGGAAVSAAPARGRSGASSTAA